MVYALLVLGVSICFQLRNGDGVVPEMLRKDSIRGFSYFIERRHC